MLSGPSALSLSLSCNVSYLPRRGTHRGPVFAFSPFCRRLLYGSFDACISGPWFLNHHHMHG